MIGEDGAKSIGKLHRLRYLAVWGEWWISVFYIFVVVLLILHFVLCADNKIGAVGAMAIGQLQKLQILRVSSEWVELCVESERGRRMVAFSVAGLQCVPDAGFVSFHSCVIVFSKFREWDWWRRSEGYLPVAQLATSGDVRCVLCVCNNAWDDDFGWSVCYLVCVIIIVECDMCERLGIDWIRQWRIEIFHDRCWRSNVKDWERVGFLCRCFFSLWYGCCKQTIGLDQKSQMQSSICRNWGILISAVGDVNKLAVPIVCIVSTENVMLPGDCCMCTQGIELETKGHSQLQNFQNWRHCS